MIKIQTIPFRYDGANTIEWKEPNLILDGEAFDLSLLNDGDSATTEGQLRYVERNGEDYVVHVTVSFDPNKSEQARLDPQEYELTENGVIDLPLYEVLNDVG